MQNFQDVMDFIQPEQVGRHWFRGHSLNPQSRIYGGQVLTQCLLAANATVDESLIAHSMHAYFLRAGDPTAPIEFEVDPIRDGRSFCTRRVVARQNDKAIFNTSVSYQVVEAGFEHSQPAPPYGIPEPSDVIPPDVPKSPNLMDLYNVERRTVTDFVAVEGGPQRLNWFKGRGQLREDPRTHQAAMALVSDFSLLSACIYRQGYRNWDSELMVASLDHAIWFHGPVDMNKGVFYGCESPWAGNARGFNRGMFWDTEGRLVGSTTQESLVRIRKES